MDECKSFLKKHIENDNILVFSSILFLIPAYVAYINELHIHCFTTVFTTIISIHNWLQYRYTNESTNLDIYVSRLSFLIYSLSGFYIVKSNILLLIGSCNIAFICIFYYLSHNSIGKEDKITENIFHFLFHFCVLFGKLLVVVL